MPKYTDIKKVLVLGSGPIVIGQAAEFDYAGTQACRALKEEGLEVVLINSNPATIMTDKDIADHVYIEPMNLPSITQIIEKERPDALLPNMGGQTGLNLAMALYENGTLEKYGVRLLGTSPASIHKAEDRQGFKDAMEEIGQNGRCRAVGVSNFSVSDLKAILDNGTVKPAANQIRYFIGHTQEALTQFCMDEGILVEGYSPLATGRILKNPEVAAIAAKYGVSLPQVCIRYVLQKNVLPLPKAVHTEYIRQNAAVDFTLSDEDMAYFDGLTDTER